MLPLLIRSNGEGEEKSFSAELVSKCGLQTSGVSNTWKLVRRASSGAPSESDTLGGEGQQIVFCFCYFVLGFFFCWSIITLQYFVSFCCTMK